MNRLFFLLTKNGTLSAKISNFVDVEFFIGTSGVDCFINNKAQGSSPHYYPNVSSQFLKDVIAIKPVQTSIELSFKDKLELHHETQATLNEMYELLKHKENIKPSSKNIISEILSITSSTGTFPLADGVDLKLLTCCNTRAAAGFELHFQICISKDSQDAPKLSTITHTTAPGKKMPFFSEPETLSCIHECVQKFPTFVEKNLQTQHFRVMNKSLSEHTQYEFLKKTYTLREQHEEMTKE